MENVISLTSAENIAFAKYRVARKEHDGNIGDTFKMHLSQVRFKTSNYSTLCEIYEKDDNFIYVKVY